MSLLFIDVGCSGGLPNPYSQYHGFNVVGFDISKPSIDSLTKKYPNNKYHHCQIGFQQSSHSNQIFKSDYTICYSQCYNACYFLMNPVEHLSVGSYVDLLTNNRDPLNSCSGEDFFVNSSFINYYKLLFSGEIAYESTSSDSVQPEVSTHHLDEFISLTSPAILKIDTDGSELSVLHSFEKGINTGFVFSVVFEAQMRGMLTADSSVFANIDTFLRQNNFVCVQLEPVKYSSAFLPSFFLTSEPAENDVGIIQFLNCVYILSPLHVQHLLHESNVKSILDSYYTVCSFTRSFDLYTHLLILAKPFLSQSDFLDLLDNISFEFSGVSYHSLINKFATHPRSFYINYFKPSIIMRIFRKLYRLSLRLSSYLSPDSLHAHLLRIES